MEILVHPEDLLSFYTANEASMESYCFPLAFSREDETIIYLTSSDEEVGRPFCFSVELDLRLELETCVTPEMAEDTYRELLAMYGERERETTGYSDNELLRLDDIRCAAEDFLQVLIRDNEIMNELTDNDIDDIVSYVEEKLYADYDISVYHPTEVDGEIILYPFDGVED